MQLSGGDTIRTPYGGAASAPVHERDVAAVAARVLTGDGHAGRIHHVTGPRSMTQEEQVRTLGAALGRPLRFEEFDPAPVRDQLARFMDRDFVAALFDLLAATVGRPAAVTSVVEDLTGRPARPFEMGAPPRPSGPGGGRGTMSPTSAERGRSWPAATAGESPTAAVAPLVVSRSGSRRG